MLAVIAFLALADSDAGRIDVLRAAHDPNAARIAAHFTLVFPDAAIGEATLIQRMEAVAKKTAPISVTLKRVMVHQEGPEFYLYLVPEQGYDALRVLHERLNPGPAAAFTPHVTVGRFADRAQARTIATELAVKHFAATGRIEALSLVAVPETGPVQPIRAAPLRG
jgi:2'-5' RNA ligase